jgi:tetrahydromethanopterin S-methyltransferase subunit A
MAVTIHESAAAVATSGSSSPTYKVKKAVAAWGSAKTENPRSAGVFSSISARCSAIAEILPSSALR